ncbi:hypothetical protein DL239_19210 [Sedimentitalea sp. CY04]|uniref:Uncharacterized protein n=1 Tax=Parasedimentitalea denitrificans TaxID=2211118 RepID=A0ABX0WBN6_9RHOB|nr:hypothetical protein [Sedimentitalea sp. CY04]NIZ63098.1 hypothetical protein [Sedimentitalea sp. CY04]
MADSIGTKAFVTDVLDDDDFDRRMKVYRDIGFDHIDPAGDPKRLYLTIKDADSADCHLPLYASPFQRTFMPAELDN